MAPRQLDPARFEWTVIFAASPSWDRESSMRPAANTALVNALGRWPDAALDDVCLPHPLMERLSVREMLAFTVNHTAHHLITRVAERAAGGGQ